MSDKYANHIFERARADHAARLHRAITQEEWAALVWGVARQVYEAWLRKGRHTTAVEAAFRNWLAAQQKRNAKT